MSYKKKRSRRPKRRTSKKKSKRKSKRVKRRTSKKRRRSKGKRRSSKRRFSRSRRFGKLKGVGYKGATSFNNGYVNYFGAQEPFVNASEWWYSNADPSSAGKLIGTKPTRYQSPNMINMYK